MLSPTILSYQEVSSGNNLNVTERTRKIIGVFYGNPTATLGGVTMTGVVNYGSIISIKKYDNPPEGNIALGGGVAGNFYCLTDVKETELDSDSGTDPSGVVIKTVDTTSTALVIGALKASDTNPPSHAIKEGTTEFSYNRNTGSQQIGYRVASGSSMTVSLGTSYGGAAIDGAVIVSLEYQGGGQVI